MNIYTDRGVVLHSIKFSENQLIVYVLTENHGRRSYITRIGSKGSGRNLYQPLFLIEFQATEGRGDLHKLSQVTASQPLTDIPYNIVKSTIALFLAEVLYRVIREDYSDNRIFNFVNSSVVALDLLDGSVANFHLHFMVRLSYYMGFEPQGRCVNGDWFDIKNGAFTSDEPKHMLRFAPRQAFLLSQLSESNIEQAASLQLCREDRAAFLDAIVEFYGFHTDSIYSVNSISMFREIF